MAIRLDILNLVHVWAIPTSRSKTHVPSSFQSHVLIVVHVRAVFMFKSNFLCPISISCPIYTRICVQVRTHVQVQIQNPNPKSLSLFKSKSTWKSVSILHSMDSAHGPGWFYLRSLLSTSVLHRLNVDLGDLVLIPSLAEHVADDGLDELYDLSDGQHTGSQAKSQLSPELTWGIRSTWRCKRKTKYDWYVVKISVKIFGRFYSLSNPLKIVQCKTPREM